VSELIVLALRICLWPHLCAARSVLSVSHAFIVPLTRRYRYAAVANHPDGTGPLAAYFHGEMMNLPGATASIFDRNKFLAEDRILAFEIVCKKNARWRLQYVKSAKAGTDVPSTVPEFISQRRRWLNGCVKRSLEHTRPDAVQIHFRPDLRDGLLLADLDIGARHLPQIRAHHPHHLQ
jgi:hypothetical protein